jgi:hypothetical protein
MFITRQSKQVMWFILQTCHDDYDRHSTCDRHSNSIYNDFLLGHYNYVYITLVTIRWLKM